MDFNPVTFSESCYYWQNTSIPQILYFSHIPTAIIALILGIFVYLKNKNSLAGKILLFFSFFFSLWCADDLFLWLTPNGTAIVFFWSLINLIEVLLIASALYFSYVFLNKKDSPVKYKIAAILLILPMVLLLPTNINIAGFTTPLCEAIQGPLIYYFYAVEIIFALWNIAYLVLKTIKTKSEERKAVISFSVGMFLFLIFFSGTSLISNITGQWTILQYGLFGMPALIASLSYLIVQYKAFDIKLLSAQVLVMGIIALVASQFSFIKNPTNIFLNAVTLFLVALFGWWLVNSVEKEVEAKETLEQKVHERTKELEQSKKVAEERAMELEKWYKLTIGRELRMAELKDKIKELGGG